MTMKGINVYKATPKQILTIEKGILSYNYLKEHFNPCDRDFKDVFTDYYLKAQVTMRNQKNNDAFFSIMNECNPCVDNIETIVRKIKNSAIDMYEFSFATKLLHTVCVAKDIEPGPIYDNKVRTYTQDVLHEIEYSFIKTGAKKEKKIDAINKDWEKLKKWYDDFLASDMGREWLGWFDEQFQNGKNISAVKKIDFIIFACN